MSDKDNKLIWESLNEEFEFGGHTGEQRINSAERQAYVISDSQGVYGVYSSIEGAAEAQTDIGGGSFVTKVSVDVNPQQYDSMSDSDLNPDDHYGDHLDNNPAEPFISRTERISDDWKDYE